MLELAAQKAKLTGLSASYATTPAKPKTTPSAQLSNQAYYHVSGCSDGAAL